MDEKTKGILDMLTVYKHFKPEQVEINDIHNEDESIIIGFEIIVDGSILFKYEFKNSVLQYGILAHKVKEEDLFLMKNEILDIYLSMLSSQNENNR